MEPDGDALRRSLLVLPNAVHMVDAQIQQLRSTTSYLYWRERRHRMTAESTHRRVLWYGVLRSLALVGVSVLQVLGVRYLFRSK